MLSTKLLSAILRSSRTAQIRHSYGVFRPEKSQNESVRRGKPYRQKNVEETFQREKPYRHFERQTNVVKSSEESPEAEGEFKSVVMKDVPQRSQMTSATPLLETTDPDEKILALLKRPDKTMDLWKPCLTKSLAGFSNVRFLISARSCHDFKMGREYLSQNLNRLNPVELLEGSRLLTLAAVCGNDQPEDELLVKNLLNRLDQLQIMPTNMRKTASILFRSLIDLDGVKEEAARALSSPGDILHRKDILITISSLLLKNGMIETFTALNPAAQSSEEEVISKSELFHSLELGYWLLYAADRANDKEKKRLLQWYLRSLVNCDDPLDHVVFLNMVTRFFGKMNVEIEKTEIRSADRLSPQKEFPVQFESVPFDIEDLKKEFKQMLVEFSKDHGSVTAEEMKDLEAEIADWKANAKSGGAIVIDALNVLHLAKMATFVKRLSVNYNNIFIVSREFTSRRLESTLWPKNTKKFFATDESEDDLMVICAALEWGPDCHVLSNDRFRKHVDRLSQSGSKSFKNWYKRRNLRLNHAIGSLAYPNVTAEKPRLLKSREGKEAILLPVVADTSLLPYFSFWLVRVPDNLSPLEVAL